MGVLFNDVVINKLSGGLGRRTPNQDMVSGLLFNSTNDADGKIEKGKLYRLVSVNDAKNLGINETYDTEGVSVYYQISQYFRMNPSGDLFIMRSDETVYAELIENNAQEMLVKANGAIRQLAITSSEGNFEATKDAIDKAAVVTKNAFAAYRPVEVFLEGKGFKDASVENLAERNAENVSVIVAMDSEKAKETTYSNTAAVGVLLGAVSNAKVSENIAWVEKFNLSGDGFSTIGFVGDKQVTEGEMVTLNNSKYIFARRHIGLPGLYFNDSHTCTVQTSDFTFIEANRTIHKAARIARTALLPKLNSPVLVDPDSGKLAPSVVKGFETLCRAALERMISNEEVSQIDVYVNPNQDILANSELEIEMSVVPMGTARRIIVNLGFKNPFQLNAVAN